MKALAPLTLDLQPRPAHRSVPVMHANGSGGVAHAVAPHFVFLQWELETNSGVPHVHRNANVGVKTRQRNVVFSEEQTASTGWRLVKRTAQSPKLETPARG